MENAGVHPTWIMSALVGRVSFTIKAIPSIQNHLYKETPIFDHDNPTLETLLTFR